MSKAKELARELLMNVGILNEVEYKALGLELIDAVLSEPEPELKGFIEVQCVYTNTLRAINCDNLVCFGTSSKGENYIDIIGYENAVMVKESYDEIKQKIARAV